MFLPNDFLAVPTGALAGDFLSREFGPIATPAQVLLSDWKAAAPPGYDVVLPDPAREIRDHRVVDAVFADVFVLGDVEAAPRIEAPPEQSTGAVTEDVRSGESGEEEPPEVHNWARELVGDLLVFNAVAEAEVGDVVPTEPHAEPGGSGGFSEAGAESQPWFGDQPADPFVGTTSPAASGGGGGDVGTPSDNGGFSDWMRDVDRFLAQNDAGTASTDTVAGAVATASAGADTGTTQAAPASEAGTPPEQPPAEDVSRDRSLPAPHLAGAFGAVPLGFELNQGQSASEVQYLAHGKGYGVFITDTEVVVSLNTTRQGEEGQALRDVLTLRIDGAQSDVEMTAEGLLPGRANYFRGGDVPLNLTDVPTYERIVAHDVLPGIDVVYQGDRQDLRFDFQVRPGVDASAVALRWDGATSVEIDDLGRLVLTTPGGTLIQDAPVLYQDGPEGRTSVEGRYDIRADGAIGFQIDAYDTSRTLVIDPTLGLSSYVGGSGNDYANGTYVDPQ